MTTNLTYLVVDDFDPIRRLVKTQCESCGVASILEASDGEQAIEILQKEKVNVVICDWNMPRVSGLDVLKYVRNHQSLAHIHFMLITAESGRESIESAIDEGVDDFLVKPFTPRMLIEKVTGILKRPPRKKAKTLSKQNDSLTSNETQETKAEKNLSNTKPTILIVDDIPTNIDIIRENLKGICKIKAATSGEKALKLVDSNSPDLILLDIMMPDMDGYEVCKLLKSELETEQIPVIFLSTKNEVTDMTRGFDLGAVDYITKPVDPDILKARVKTHLQLKHSKDEMAYQIRSLMEVAKLREDVERITRHDLKNPLSAILHKAESLMDLGYLHIEQKNDAEVIRDAANDVLGMINRSLDLFKMETGSYQLDAIPIDFGAITLKVVNESRANAHHLGISIKFESPPNCIVLGEELLCFSILGNLIKNAVEASSTNDDVTVMVEVDENEAKVLIHNVGTIPENIRENFFDKYTTEGKDGGTGIGTYSARLMAVIQNGNVTFSSHENSGTTLTYTMPLDNSMEQT